MFPLIGIDVIVCGLAMDAARREAFLGSVQKALACRYCGRSTQTPGRKTCDGCGAPR